MVLVMIDVDYFKWINDLFGYFIGDCVLVVFGCLVVSELCEVDVLVCWGGEEFILLFLEIGLEVVVVLVECLC